jgi:23S rRNA (guanosine2251-2'-O)-methyltransferase
VAILIGIHPVAEALRARRPLDRVLVAKGVGGARVQEIIELSRKNSTPLRFEDRAALDRLAGSAVHQGVVALGAAKQYAELDDIAGAAHMLVVLDGLEDPHNLGAVIRTAHAAGADAIVVPERRAAGLTDTVAKAAAGALEHLPVVRVTNINRALEHRGLRGARGAGVRRGRQGTAPDGTPALRRGAAHSHVRENIVTQRVSSGGRSAVRLEAEAAAVR